MSARFVRLSRLRPVCAVLVAAGMLVAPVTATRAAGSKQLQHVRGTVGYQPPDPGAAFTTVFAKFDLPDDDLAVTRAQSAAVLAMPDSSLISLGENTAVRASAFDSSATGPGSTITINNGSLRFDIRRPAGGASNYRFVTPTSQTAVRGTVGLLSFVNGVTTVGCVACAADSVTVTVGTQTIALVTGQFITISAAGVIATGAISAVAGTFSAAGVPVTAQTGALAAGLPAAAAGVSTAAVAGAAAVGAAAIGVAASSHSSPQPQAMPTASQAPSPTSTGSASLTSHATTAAPASTGRVPQPVPLAVPGAGRSGR